MVAIYGVLVILAILAPWAFLKTKPWHDNEYQVLVFNRMILGMTAMFVVVWCLGSWMYLTSAQLDDVLGIVMALGAVAVEVVMLVIFFFVRMWMFKSKNYRPGKWS
jgi:hypothetical protein